MSANPNETSGVDQATADELVAAAHRSCAQFQRHRGDIDVVIAALVADAP
jgi:organic hydroperoxide reductase OsmC/OhrA